MDPTMKTVVISVGSLAAVGAAVAMGAAVWNSRRMKLLRAYRRAGRILEETEHTADRLRANVNPGLCLEMLLYTMKGKDT